MKKMLTIALSLMTSFSTFAGPKDVINPVQSEYIRVTNVGEGNNLVRFELCSTKTSSAGNNNSCKLLGSRSYVGGYTLDELESQRRSEYYEVAFSTLGSAASLVVGGAAGGFGAFHVGTLMSKTTIEFAAGWVLGGVVTGGAVGVSVLGNFVDALNPFSQWRDTQVLAPEIIHDEEVTTDKDIKGLAKNLDIILKKINS